MLKPRPPRYRHIREDEDRNDDVEDSETSQLQIRDSGFTAYPKTSVSPARLGRFDKAPTGPLVPIVDAIVINSDYFDGDDGWDINADDDGEDGLGFLNVTDTSGVDSARHGDSGTPKTWTSAWMPQRNKASRQCVRRWLMSMRLRRVYVVYCILFFAASVIVCLFNVGRAIGLLNEDEALVIGWLALESELESAVGVAVCAETFSTFFLVGRRAFFRDCWCVLDATVSFLIIANWALLALHAALLSSALLNLDFLVLAMRFIVQPCRVFTAISMIRRMRKMQRSSDIKIELDVPEKVRSSTEKPLGGYIMTSDLQAELREHLPLWCRHHEWRLAYSVDEHGVSLNTFYRSQRGGGPNVLVLRDSDGVVLGGFASEAWRICPKGYNGSMDCFVFSSLGPKQSGERVKVYCASEGSGGPVLLLNDERGISFGSALYIMDGFSKGSTMACPAFCSPPLVPSVFGRAAEEHTEFVISNFECWQFCD